MHIPSSPLVFWDTSLVPAHMQEITGKSSSRLTAKICLDTEEFVDCYFRSYFLHPVGNYGNILPTVLPVQVCQHLSVKSAPGHVFISWNMKYIFFLLFRVIKTVKVRCKTWKLYKNTCFPTSGSRRKEIQQLRILNARRNKVTDCTVDVGKKTNQRGQVQQKKWKDSEMAGQHV